jgi:light-regulated signal transduction histidine kinase (bacteriophytochrome)
MANSLAISKERLKDLERQLERRTAELREARKELEDFNYSVSHDLRAPVRHISGYAQIILEDYSNGLDCQCRKYMEGIQEGIRTMGTMVDELLKLSRLGRQDVCLIPVALEKLFRDLSRDFTPGSAERIVEWKIGTLPQVECDPTMMKQAVFNLVANAVKFTRTRAHAVIEVGTINQDGGAVIFIRDNGVGFDMKYADKLFNMFQRLHPAREFEGIGAGLAIAERILRRHGGRIWAEAIPDKGATFYFTLDGISAPSHQQR